MIAEASPQESIETDRGCNGALTPEVRVQDRALRGAIRLGVRVDRALGRALKLLRERTLFRPLGFVRMADYAREVVGLGVRSVQEMIRTEESLEKLPLIAFSWEMGLLQAEQVRLLSRVATCWTEQEWLARAKGLSVRELSALVKQREKSEEEGFHHDEGARCERRDRPGGTEGRIGEATRCEGADGGSGPGENRDGAGKAKDEPCMGEDGSTRTENQPEDKTGESDTRDGPGESASVRVSFSAPVPAAVRWRQTLRFCAAVSGADLPDWALVENICAEFLSGCPLPETGQSAEAGDPSGLAPGGDPEPDRWRSSPAGETSGFPSGDGLPPEGMDPQREANLRSAWVPSGLDSFLSRQPPTEPWALHERIVRLAALRSRLDSLLSRQLFGFVLDGGPWQAGYRGLAGYAREVLGVGERRARYLVSLERKLQGATMLREEYRRGRLSWLQCWMVMSVARGEASEAAWVDYARQVTLLRLRRAVEDARCRAASEWPCLPPPVEGGGEQPGLQMSALPSGELSDLGDRQASAFASGELGDLGDRQASASPASRPARTARRSSWQPVSEKDDGYGEEADEYFDDEEPPEDCRIASDAPTAELDWRMPASPAAWRRMTRVSFTAPAEIAQLWRRTMAELRRVHGRQLRDWEAVEKLLDSFMETWDSRSARGLRREDRILRRDGWQCTVPACSSMQNLQVHHVLFKSRGGGDEESNLTVLCESHHLHGVHGEQGGRVIVQGHAPRRLRWILGARDDGPPVMRFEGERRVFRLGDRERRAES